MEKLTLSRGFTPKLEGMPDLSVIRLPSPQTIGISAQDIPYIRPKLLVKEDQEVQTGTPVFTDKRDNTIQYVSPATGRIKEIRFGARRRLLEIVVDPAKTDAFVPFDPVPADRLRDMPKADLTRHLKQGGLWQALRQFPAGDTADPDHIPAIIIVSLNGNDLFSPHPALVVRDQVEAFETGLTFLERFSHRIVVTARKSSLAALEKIPEVRNRITHVTEDTYPAWNPGAVLYRLKQDPSENSSWSISLPHLLMIGNFLITGTYPVERMVTLTQSGDSRPHLLTRQGAPIKRLAGHMNKDSIITTGQFNGRQLAQENHLGFFEDTVNILRAENNEEMFGFALPGLDKTSVSSTFLSSLFKGPARVDGTLHGELRACINCSYCERICPNGMMPSFIMKALLSEEIEEALSLGLLDCCQCGLCSFTCPSKIELAKLLSDGIESYHKDKA